MSRLRAYIHYLVLGFAELVAYRVAVVMLAISIPIVLFARYYVFAALYADDENRLIAGYSLSGILTYLAISWLLRSFFRTNVDRRIGRDVRSGDIIFDMLRPLNFHAMCFFRSLGKSANRFIFIAIPLIVIFILTDVLVYPSDPATWAAFLFSVAIAFVLAFEVQFLIGIMAFYTGYNINLIWTFDMIVQLLSGLILPLNFYPDSLADLLMKLPFRHIYYTPARVFMERIEPADWLPTLTDGLGWIAVLGFVNWLVFHRGKARIAIAGG